MKEEPFRFSHENGTSCEFSSSPVLQRTHPAPSVRKSSSTRRWRSRLGHGTGGRFFRLLDGASLLQVCLCLHYRRSYFSLARCCVPRSALFVYLDTVRFVLRFLPCCASALRLRFYPIRFSAYRTDAMERAFSVAVFGSADETTEVSRKAEDDRAVVPSRAGFKIAKFPRRIHQKPV